MSTESRVHLFDVIPLKLVRNHFGRDAMSAWEILENLSSISGDITDLTVKRQLLDAHNWPHLLLPVIPLSILAYLVRKPNTVFFRLFLFPFASVTAFRGAFSFNLPGPEYVAYNIAKCKPFPSFTLKPLFIEGAPGLIYIVVLGKALDYTFYGAGIYRPKPIFSSVALEALEQDTTMTPVTINEARSSVGHEQEKICCEENEVVLKRDNWKLLDYVAFLVISPRGPMFELLLSLRGLGLDYGRSLAVPPETRPFKRQPFMRATILKLIAAFLSLDLIDTFWKSGAPFSQPGGGSIFNNNLPWYICYTLSTIYHISTGLLIISAFEMGYCVCTLIGVGLLAQPPRAWPPIFLNPLASECLQEFWAIRWHQMLRRTFFVFGGILGHWIGRRLGRRDVGLLFGTFLASGLCHELPLFALGRGWDWRMIAFFVGQALFILVEKAWHAITGRPVSGIIGRIWVFFAVIVFGQLTFTSSLQEGGLGASVIVPARLSPIRRMVFPVIVATAEQIPSLAALWSY